MRSETHASTNSKAQPARLANKCMAPVRSSSGKLGKATVMVFPISGRSNFCKLSKASRRRDISFLAETRSSKTGTARTSFTSPKILANWMRRSRGALLSFSRSIAWIVAFLSPRRRRSERFSCPRALDNARERLSGKGGKVRPSKAFSNPSKSRAVFAVSGASASKWAQASNSACPPDRAHRCMRFC